MITRGTARRHCSPRSTWRAETSSASAWTGIVIRSSCASCAPSIATRLHLIADNYATHNHAKVKAWLDRHPRFHLHFTPTSASWLNQVERFFGQITEDRIRRGAFHSVADLEASIE